MVKNDGIVMESYEITSVTLDSVGHLINVSLSRLYRDEINIIRNELRQHYFNENFAVSVLAVDPMWDETSTPPKPKGFDFDQPETWGGLDIDQIPLVKKIQRTTKLSGLYTTNINEEDEFGFVIEKYVLLLLQENGVIPKEYYISYKDV